MLSFLVPAALALVGCGDDSAAPTIYVLTPPAKADIFTQDLGVIVKRYGLEPNPGHATDDKGHTLWVLEARGKGVRLWSQNEPMSGDEDPAICGKYTEGHPDPGQYVISINKVFAWGAHDPPSLLLSKISKDLTRMGYDVRTHAVDCSPVSKLRASSS
jgi:hypothetical protein